MFQNNILTFIFFIIIIILISNQFFFLKNIFISSFREIDTFHFLPVHPNLAKFNIFDVFFVQQKLSLINIINVIYKCQVA